MKLSQNENTILKYIKNNRSITNKEGIIITDLSSAGVRKIIADLQKKGLIDAVGEGKSRYYVLKTM